MKNREISCKFYDHEHVCNKFNNRDAEFYGYCQKCPDYVAKKGAAAARPNIKRKKLEDARRKDADD